MMEETPHEFVPPRRKPKVSLPPQRDAATVLVDALVHTCFTTIERVLSMESEFVEVARRFAHGHNGSAPASASSMPPAGLGGDSNHAFEHANGNGLAPSLDDLRRTLPDLLSPAERLPFNAICRGPQRLEWTAVPLDKIRQFKKQVPGATTNDAILTLLTLALQRYARLHRVAARHRKLRIIIPVSVRGRDHATDLGNRITFVPVNLPLDVARPAKLLAAVQQRTALLKSTHIAEIVATAGGMLATVPTGVQALLGPIASQLPLSVCNLICTNVPGPRSALYLMGHKLLSCYPYVPIGGEMGMNCAVITYDGTTYFGFTGDTGAIPDLHVLPELLQRSYRESRVRERGRKNASHGARRGTAAEGRRSRLARAKEPEPPKTISEVQSEAATNQKTPSAIEPLAYAAAGD